MSSRTFLFTLSLYTVSFLLFGSVGEVAISRSPRFDWPVDSFWNASMDGRIATDMNVTYGTLEIIGGANVCSGLVSIAPLSRSVFGNTSFYAKLTCSAACNIGGAGPTLPAMNATWIPPSVYAATVATYGGGYCKLYKPPEPPTYPSEISGRIIFATVMGDYWINKAERKGDGVANISIICYGNFSTYNGTTLLSTQDVSAALPTSYQLFPGNYQLRTDLQIGDCAAFVRSIEGDRAMDCLYKDTTKSFEGQKITGNILSFTVYNGPNITNTTPLSISPESARAGQSVSFSISIRNNGDVSANITAVSVIGLDPATLSISPATPFALAPGESITISGSGTIPAGVGEGQRDIALRITYSSMVDLIGPCDESRTMTFSRTMQIFIGPITPVSVFLNITPISILHELVVSGERQNVTITGRITRDDPYDKKIGDIAVNVTISRFVGGATPWQIVKYRYETSPGSYETMPKDAKYCDISGVCARSLWDAPASLHIGSEIANFTIVQPIGRPKSYEAWPIFVYKVDVSVWDSKNKSLQSAAGFFIIYALDQCVKLV